MRHGRKMFGVNDVFVSGGDGKGELVQGVFKFDWPGEEEETRDAGGNRLFRYIGAGGLRQTRRTEADDVRERKSRTFAWTLLALAILWAVFYLVPCG